MNLLEQLTKHYNPDAWAEHPCTCGQCGIIYARLRVDAKAWVRKALAQGDREGWVRLLDEIRGEGK